MRLINNNIHWLKHILIIGVLIIIGQLVIYFISYKTRDAELVTGEFMKLVTEKRTESLSDYLTDKNLYYQHQDAFSDIYKYEKSGHGVEPNGDVWIHYYMKGLPADDRNISFLLIREGTSWIISDIHINYHIHRADKEFANKFTDWLITANNPELKTHLPDHSDEQIIRLIEMMKRFDRAHIYSAKVIYLNKNETVPLRRSEFVYTDSKNKQRLSFRIKYDLWYTIESIIVE